MSALEQFKKEKELARGFADSIEGGCELQLLNGLMLRPLLVRLLRMFADQDETKQNLLRLGENKI